MLAIAAAAAAAKFSKIKEESEKVKGIKETEHEENSRPFQCSSSLLSALCPSLPTENLKEPKNSSRLLISLTAFM